MKTCCGGIVGMGETRGQRAGLLQTLANLPEHPQSVPINRLVQVEGTPLAGTALLDPFEFVRTIAAARIIMPASMVRLSAGRAEMSEVGGAHTVIDGRRLLSFSSNDYLGLAQHPALVEAMNKAASRWGVGASAAHLLGGHREEHSLLEAELAAWTGRERALLFSTGYMANLGVMQALLDPRDFCIQDKLNHACLIDGARMAGARMKRYLHLDD
jgi:hypothetical protein